MAKSDPTKDPDFQKVVRAVLTTKPQPQKLKKNAANKKIRKKQPSETPSITSRPWAEMLTQGKGRLHVTTSRASSDPFGPPLDPARKREFREIFQRDLPRPAPPEKTIPFLITPNQH